MPFVIVLLFIGITAYVFIRIKFNYIFRIKGETIKLQASVFSENENVKRVAFLQNKKNEELISHEAFLRKLAYKNTTIKTDETFFNDSDMESDYYIVVVYDKKYNIPLLSARYYFDRSAINKCLKGDCNSDIDNSYLKKNFSIDKFNEGSVFLADRLSGNTHSRIYRKHRNYIFLILYSEIFTHNKICNLILMARKDKYEKLLTKYLRLGLHIIGSTTHKGKEHWILLGDLKKSYSELRFSFVSNIILMSKYFLFKTKAK